MIPAELLGLIQRRILFIPFFMLLKREVHRFSKVLFQTVFIPTAHSALYLVIFGVSLGQQLNFSQVSYLEFIIPGLVMMACLMNAFQNSSSSILSLKYGGDIMDLKVTALTTQQIMWALSFGGVCRGFVVGGIVFIVGEMFHYFYLGRWLIPVSIPYLITFALIAGLVFSKIGMAVAFWAKTIDHLGAVGGVIITPLTYLGGIFFSIEILSPFWRQVSLFNPILYFINGIRYSLLGVSDVPINTCLVVSLISLVFVHIICAYTVKHGHYHRW